MANADFERPVQQSVLDRLMSADDSAARAGGAHAELRGSGARAEREASVQFLKAAVRRDLEWLLNARRTPAAAPPEFKELTRSLYHYGIPDMTARSRTSRVHLEELTQQIQEAVELFEPRLTHVRVMLANDAPGVSDALRDVHFVIEAVLRLDPLPERVVFDTVLETASGEVQVKGAADA